MHGQNDRRIALWKKKTLLFLFLLNLWIENIEVATKWCVFVSVSAACAVSIYGLCMILCRSMAVPVKALALILDENGVYRQVLLTKRNFG